MFDVPAQSEWEVDRAQMAVWLESLAGRFPAPTYWSYLVHEGWPAVDSEQIELSFRTIPDDWVEIYEGMNASRVDPVLSAAQESWKGAPVVWAIGDLRNSGPSWSPAQLALFDAVESYGWCGGVSYPLRGPGGAFATFSLVAKGDGFKFRFAYEDMASEWNNAALAVHDWATSVAYRKQRRLELEPTQAEILEHFARGLQRKQVADLVNIHEKTVDYHLQKAKTLLGAKTRDHVIAIALNAGLIRLKPWVGTASVRHEP